MPKSIKFKDKDNNAVYIDASAVMHNKTHEASWYFQRLIDRIPWLFGYNPANIDNLTNRGIYQVMNTTPGTFPSNLGGNQATIIVSTDDGNYNAQLAFGFSGNPRIAIRTRSGSTTWSAWKYTAVLT